MKSDINFYDLIPNSIGNISYKKVLKISDEEKQKIVSKNSNERMRAFLNNFTYGMTGNDPIDIQATFIKSREDSWNDLEEFYETKYLTVQIGQKESIEAIGNIEKQEWFRGWENPYFVDLIKNSQQ